jgi:hypothetical protein
MISISEIAKEKILPMLVESGFTKPALRLSFMGFG